jgi:cell division septation protein DedD
MASTHDDSFREIQLSGKQVVFYFMAAVVFLVVVFLMGVQVGRGVLSQRGLPDAADASGVGGETEPAPPPAAATQGASAPLTANEKLSYAERLASSEPAAEQLKKQPEDTPPPTPKSERSAERGPQHTGRPPAPTSTPAPAPAVSAEPPGPGFSIQVAALQKRDEADTIVKRLAGKGYPAYVLAPAKGSASIFRVRVGKYKDRREADTVAAKLQKEEQFKPWVVR